MSRRSSPRSSSRALRLPILPALLLLPLLTIFATPERGAAASDDPSARTPEMRRWLRWNVSVVSDERGRLDDLDRALAGRTSGILREVADWSGGAEQVFERREADCVGYAFLFYALAAELGDDLIFVLEEKVDSVEERPGVRVLRRHLAVASPRLGLVYDFSGARRLMEGVHKPVELATARAILESNRGAQALLRGESADAVRALSRAVEADPELALAWRNLAVALRREGDDGGFAEAWQRANDLEEQSAVGGSPATRAEARTAPPRSRR